MKSDDASRNANLSQNHQEVLDRLIQQHNAIAEAEEALREQRAELLRTMTVLGEMHLTAQGQPDTESEELLEENRRLQMMVEERDQLLNEISAKSREATEEKAMISRLEEENQSLRQQLQKKETQARELQTKVESLKDASPESMDIEEYEAELNEFRRQLESDRQVLNDEISQLRARNAELNETARQAELELSRERAQLARERSQLDRLREEVRLELERAQRDGAVRERLASVQRLKDRLGER